MKGEKRKEKSYDFSRTTSVPRPSEQDLPTGPQQVRGCGEMTGTARSCSGSLGPRKGQGGHLLGHRV